MSRAKRSAHIGTGYLFDATRKTLCEKEKEMKNMHDMTDAEIQRRSNAFMRDYDDIRAEIDEIGIEMD